jgi:hypothetical protein
VCVCVCVCMYVWHCMYVCMYVCMYCKEECRPCVRDSSWSAKGYQPSHVVYVIYVYIYIYIYMYVENWNFCIFFRTSQISCPEWVHIRTHASMPVLIWKHMENWLCFAISSEQVKSQPWLDAQRVPPHASCADWTSQRHQRGSQETFINVWIINVWITITLIWNVWTPLKRIWEMFVHVTTALIQRLNAINAFLKKRS